MKPEKCTPEIYYQYRPFTQHTINTLCRDELYFASPDTFNDPMDCKPSVIGNNDYDVNSLREILRKLLEQRTVNVITEYQKYKTKSKGKGLPDYMIIETLNDIRERAQNPEEKGVDYDELSVEKSLLLGQITHELLKHYDKGVSCFSSKDDCPLMWSHYADRHAGFCVGYTVDRVPEPNLHEVTYGDSRTIDVDVVYQAIVLQDSAAIGLLEKLILAKKAEPWIYESEWRLFDEKGSKDSPLKMREIIFGMKCSYSVIHTVIKALETRERPVDFFQIIQSYDSYKLRKVPVEVSELQSFYPRVSRSGEEVFGPAGMIRI